MTLSRRCLTVFLPILSLAFPLPTAQSAGLPSGPIPQFQKDDRWCVFGDSITHNGSWHKFVYLFYATRFPDRKFEIFNCGISGDTATKAIARLDWDVIAHKPTVCTLMFGMNDVGRNNYATTAPAEAADTRDKSITTYAVSLRTLSEKLHEAGSRLVFISPTHFDETADWGPEKASPLVHVNDGLARCGELDAALAGELSAPFLDLHTPLLELTRAQQQKNPAFTLLRDDRVHPEEPGHLIMAYHFLKAQGVSGLVSRMAIDTEKNEPVAADNCTVEELKLAAENVSFLCTENSLPFPIDPAEAPALKLIPFMSELNQEILQITHLAPGKYDLFIDDERIGTWNDQTFAAGINLAEQTNSPQYIQARAVQKLNQQRHELVRTILRTIAYVERSLGRPSGADDTSILEKAKNAKSSNEFISRQYAAYGDTKPKQTETEKRIAELTAELWDAARPQVHRYRVTRVK